LTTLFSGAAPEEPLQTRLKARNFSRRCSFCGTNELGRISRVDIDAEHPHPLRGIGHAAGLTHTAAPKPTNRRHVQQVLEVSGTGVAGDLQDRVRIIIADGKTMTANVEDKLRDTTGKWTAQKQ
jgi:hypothetical protein